MTNPPRITDILASIDVAGQRAIVAGTAAVFCLLLFSALFWNEASAAIGVWIVSPTFNHCFLVLPLSLFMIWQRRNSLIQTLPAPNARAVIAVLGLSGVWLVTSIVGVLEAEQFVVITMVQATLLGVLGVAFYKRLAAPFLFLYFLVPSGDYLVPTLQNVTAQFSVLGLQVLGIPVFSNGTVIDIPAGSFAIAEACAGLRFLIAAIAFGVFFSVITYKSVYRRLAFVACSIVIPVVANGLRVLGLLAAAQWFGNPTAVLADHLIYGWIFFSLVLVMLIFIGELFSDRHGAITLKFAPETSSSRPFSWLRLAFVAIACLLAAASGPVLGVFAISSQSLNLPQTAPHVAPPWRLAEAAPEWRPIVMRASRSFSETFVHDGHEIDRFIALGGGVGRDNDLIRSANRAADEKIWRFDAASDELLSVKGHVVPVRASIWFDGANRRIVWSFYVVNGQPVSSFLSARLNEAYAVAMDSKCATAYVALSMRVTDVSADARAAEELLAATEPLTAYLCEPAKIRERR